MQHILSLILLCASVACLIAQPKPITLHPENPHYFQYQNKPLILITSGEHYGAVLNLDFDFEKYLSTLSADGLNLTRTFTGIYIEPPGAFNIERNTLAPVAGRFIAPWRRSTQPGFNGGGNKFDLSQWDDAYFTRLKQFMDNAQQKNIIVELALFCPFYEKKQWLLSPLHPDNNINDTPATGKDSVHTLDHSGPLLAIQEQLVRKIVTELNGYPNLIFEICNEPYFGGVTIEWQHHIASLIEETEKELPRKHLISQNIANDSALIVNPHPGISVFNFHYATPPTAVRQNYHLNKVIGDNETGFRGQADSTYRKEGWEIILAGGGLYNNLDYSFTPGFENGTFKYPEKQPGGGSPELRKQLAHLMSFMNGFRFIDMKPDRDFKITAGKAARMHMLSEKGKQYAAYILHGERATVTLELPKGTYDVSWIDPVSGRTVSTESLKVSGGQRSVQSPAYEFDIALRIIRKR